MKKQRNREEVEQLLQSLDKDMSWSEQRKSQLKQRLMYNIESKTKKRFLFPSMNYYFSLAAVCLLILLIFVPIWNSDEGLLFNQASTINIDGIKLDLSHIEEQSDGSVQARLNITNNSEYTLVRNEIFVQNLNGVFNENGKPKSEYNDWTSRIDMQSKILDVNIVSGDISSIIPKSTVQIEFRVQPEFVDAEDYQIMLQSVPDRNNGQIPNYYVLNLIDQNISAVNKSNSVSNNYLFLLALSLLLLILSVFILRFLRSIKVKAYLIVTTIILLTVVYFANIARTDDFKAIEEELTILNQPMAEIAHVEFLDNRNAIAFYEWGAATDEYFGTTLFHKGLNGWGHRGGSTGASSSRYKIGWGFSNISESNSDYTDLVKGKIYDPEIKQIRLVTKDGQEYDAQIVAYNNGERFYYLLANEKQLDVATVYGLSQNGEIIEQIN